MRSLTLCIYSFGLVALLPCAALGQQASVSGRITEAEEGLPLAGANVVVLDAGTLALIGGAASGADGGYVITSIPPGDYILSVRFIGFAEVRTPITLEPGEQETANFSLQSSGFDLNTVVVTASRQAEKVLDAPASITVLDAEELEAPAILSSAAVLRNTVGVDMAQTGIDRYEIVLRGFNNAFSGAAYVLTDYRQGAIASLGVNAYQMMPITQIDLERVEVVRGPGSALYGAGVDTGVIHFITKDPFTYPGTTVSISGGERSLFMASARHAGILNEKLGYKVVGTFTRGDDWQFDPNDRLDSLQLDSFREEALPVDYNTYKYNLNGTLAYRLRPSVTLTANGGFSSSKSIFLSGIGTLQSDGFGYSYGQLRLQAGRFFAQAYVNANNAGDSFVYRDTAVEEVVDNSILFNTQAQYDFGLMQERLNLIVGADYELTAPSTDETITGRNENSDETQEVGAYAQATAHVTSKLDVTGAVRADYNNVVDQLQISPRAALVFKPTAEHSLRATFNRAFSSPGTNSLFLDINAGAAGPNDVLLIQARGAADGFHFQRDPALGGLVASSLIPDIFGSRVPVGMPMSFVYDQVYDALAAIPTAQLQAILSQQGINLTQEQVAGLVALLSPQAGTNVTGFTRGELGFLNLTTETVDRTADDVVDIDPLEQTVSHTFEVGYKGLLGSRLLVSIDGYYVNKSNFVGPLLVESPFVLSPSQTAVINDLRQAMAAGIAGNQTLNAQLQAIGLTPEQVAALLTQLSSANLEAALPGQGSPIGIVQPEENAIPGQLLLSYRNYGKVEYYGVDIATHVLVTDRLDLFGNLSWVNDNFFDAEELNEDPDSPLELAMNAPKLKVKGGFDYSVPQGIRVNASVRHVGEFEVRSGPYQGTIPSYTLLDVGAGYDLDRFVSGLRFDVTVLNALDETHREFIGAPQMGRLAIARLTYDVN